MATSGSGGDRIRRAWNFGARNRRGRGTAFPCEHRGARACVVRKTRSARPRKARRRRSARIGRGERDERRGIVRWGPSEHDEDRNGAKAADDGNLGEACGRGDVSHDVVEVVVIEDAELPGGIGRVGIGQRRQRNGKRDDEERKTETEDAQHWLIRYYRPMRSVNQ